MIRKGLQFTALILLSYLLQTTVAGDVAIGGVAPNFAIAIIAVVSIALGRKYTFIISLAVGYLLEIMIPSLDYIYLILYPVWRDAGLPCVFGQERAQDGGGAHVGEKNRAPARARPHDAVRAFKHCCF